MRSYDTARGFFSFMGYLSWALIALGVLVAGAALPTIGSQAGPVMLLAAVPGFLIAGAGIFGLIYVQSSRAAVDSAEYGQQALQVARDQLEISKQLLKLAKPVSNSATYDPSAEDTGLSDISFDTDDVAPATSAPPATAPDTATSPQPLAHNYDGVEIAVEDGKFLVEDRTYDTLIDAKLAIDGDRLRANVQQDGG